MQLRPYQENAVKAIFHEWEEGRKRTLLVMATGTGKTICFSAVIQEEVKRGNHILVLAHRGELLEQAQDKLQIATGIKSSLEKANLTTIGNTTDNAVVIGSVQSMSGKRLELFDKNAFDTIIIDEAHHCMSDSYQKVLKYFSNAKVLGVTATPERADKKDLSKYFDSKAFEYSLIDAIKDGYLCDIKVQRVPLQLDITNVSVHAGDYAVGELASAIDPYLDSIGEAMRQYCKNKKTVVFTPLIKTSLKFKDILSQKGFSVVEINGNSTDREKILKDFNNNQYDVILNSMLLTEGWDCPSVDCIIVLRPTKSYGLYMQMIGRGTRLFDNKKNLLLLDFLWLTKTHDIMNAVTLVAPNQEIAQRMNTILFDGEVQDLMEGMEQAKREYNIDLEKSMKNKLDALKKKKMEVISSVQFFASIGELGTFNEPYLYRWQNDPPTQKQLDLIRQSGLETEDILSKGLANRVISILMQRKKDGKSTVKQIKLLERYGFKRVGEWSCKDATKIIGLISNNHWHVPKGIYPSIYIPKISK